jgi:hypothetical protein
MFITRQKLHKQVPAATNGQATIEVLLGYNDRTVFSVGSTRRLCNEDPRLAESELRESMKVIEKKWQERKSCKSAAVQRRLHVCYSYCDTDIIPVSKSVARIRLVKPEVTSVCVTLNCKVCRSAIAL